MSCWGLDSILAWAESFLQDAFMKQIVQMMISFLANFDISHDKWVSTINSMIIQ